MEALKQVPIIGPIIDAISTYIHVFVGILRSPLSFVPVKILVDDENLAYFVKVFVSGFFLSFIIFRFSVPENQVLSNEASFILASLFVTFIMSILYYIFLLILFVKPLFVNVLKVALVATGFFFPVSSVIFMPYMWEGGLPTHLGGGLFDEGDTIMLIEPQYLEYTDIALYSAVATSIFEIIIIFLTFFWIKKIFEMSWIKFTAFVVFSVISLPIGFHMQERILILFVEPFVDRFG